MKLCNLATEEREDFLLHIIAYMDGCCVCLRSGEAEGTEDTCTQTSYRGNPMYGGKLCPDMDFNDCRPLKHEVGIKSED